MDLLLPSPKAGSAPFLYHESCPCAAEVVRAALQLRESEEELTPGMCLVFWGASLFLVVLAGLMSGLTLGLMSLDRVDIEVVKRSGTPKQLWLVERIEPLMSHPHFLLVTLLLTNAVAMEALPIFLDRLMNPVAAILISVSAVLLFGEIIPQAVCKRHGLQVGARLAWLVRALMMLTAAISYPIAKLLDYLLGEETALFRRAELKALVSMHAEPPDDGGTSTLTQDEVAVIQGALDMATKTAEAAMTPLEKVFMFSSEAVINDDLLKQAIDRGHSRVPVYEGSRQNIIGLILVKELVLVDEDRGIKIKELRLREIPFLRSDTPLFDVLKIFRTGRSHMAVLTRVGAGGRSSSIDEGGGASQHGPPGLQSEGSVHGMGGGTAMPSSQGWGAVLARAEEGSQHGGTAGGRAVQRGSKGAGVPRTLLPSSKDFQEAIGVITIEDVLEELLQQEIVDETDRYVDNLQTVQTTTLLSLQHLPPNLRKFLTRTFRVNSPVNRAAFQAALAAQSPFASPPGAASVAVAGSEAGVGAVGSGGISPTPSALTSPQRHPVTVVAAVAAAAAAAAAAEATADGLQQSAQKAQRLSPPKPSTIQSEDVLTLRRQGSASQGMLSPATSTQPSPLKPPLPKLRVKTSLTSEKRPLLDPGDRTP